QHVLEAPELVEGAQPQRLTIGPQAHGAAEGAFEHRQAAVGAMAEEKEFSCLVRGKGEAHLLFAEPASEVGRTGHLDPGRVRRPAAVGNTATHGPVPRGDNRYPISIAALLSARKDSLARLRDPLILP